MSARVIECRPAGGGPTTTTEAQETANALRNQYARVRVLPDGSVAALHSLMYTRAIYLGLTFYGYERRFCFASPALAEERFAALQSEDDEPQGYVARR